MSEWPPQSPLAVAMRCACPRCGRGKLFRGVLTVVDRCAVCDLDLRSNDTGDGPAVFVILGLGALTMMLVLWLEFRFEPPVWVYVVVVGPLIFAVAIGLLRFLKALLVAQQYTHRSTALDGEKDIR
jgi:uncharacterized protein (DUF983 family)